MSDAVLVVAIVVTGLVLATLGTVAIGFGKTVSASVGPDKAEFRAAEGAQGETPQTTSTGRRSTKAKS